ncbi:MAG: class E sortase [Actinobacteria bacterium]|nr:class E sortase [Actinomycetota bacterium]
METVDASHPRTPVQRDWYWFLGRLGQTLITLGILMFLFVGYQLWGTGIEESQAQDRLASQFERLNTQAIITVPSSSDDGTSSVPSDTTDSNAPLIVDEGDAIAVIEIPRIGVTKYVVAGVAPDDLKKGPGHFPSTPQPGHLGNMAIAGHRTTYGEPFRNIDQLELGDEIIVTDIQGREFTYVVDSQKIVGPSDSYVVATTDPNVARLTLTTCHPEFSASERLIVSAVLDTAVSTPVDDKPFVYAKFVDADERRPLPSDDSIVADNGGNSEASIEVTDAAVGLADEYDTFSRGWFSDSAAWPHVIGWVLVQSVVIALGWYLARRSRRWIGVAAAVLPFFVVLYFVFQNVNRLLPPNL